MNWTAEDFKAGLCALSDLGKPKPELVAPEDEKTAPVDPKATLRQLMKNDALAAYRQLGGVEYLKGNKDLLDKVLAKALPPESVMEPKGEAKVEFPDWIKAQRLAYRMGSGVAADISPDADEPWANDPPELRAMIQAFLVEHPELFEAAQKMVEAMRQKQLEPPPDDPLGGAVSIFRPKR